MVLAGIVSHLAVIRVITPAAAIATP